MIDLSVVRADNNKAEVRTLADMARKYQYI